MVIGGLAPRSCLIRGPRPRPTRFCPPARKLRTAGPTPHGRGGAKPRTQSGQGSPNLIAGTARGGSLFGRARGITMRPAPRHLRFPIPACFHGARRTSAIPAMNAGRWRAGSFAGCHPHPICAPDGCGARPGPGGGDKLNGLGANRWRRCGGSLTGPGRLWCVAKKKGGGFIESGFVALPPCGLPLDGPANRYGPGFRLPGLRWNCTSANRGRWTIACPMGRTRRAGRCARPWPERASATGLARWDHLRPRATGPDFNDPILTGKAWQHDRAQRNAPGPFTPKRNGPPPKCPALTPKNAPRPWFLLFTPEGPPPLWVRENFAPRVQPIRWHRFGPLALPAVEGGAGARPKPPVAKYGPAIRPFGPGASPGRSQRLCPKCFPKPWAARGPRCRFKRRQIGNARANRKSALRRAPLYEPGLRWRQ